MYSLWEKEKVQVAHMHAFIAHADANDTVILHSQGLISVVYHIMVVLNM